MTFLLVRKPLGSKLQPLAEPDEMTVDFEDVVRSLITVLDPSSLTKARHQVRLQVLDEVELAFLYMRKLYFKPFQDEPDNMRGLLWWSYSFISQGADTEDMQLIRGMVRSYALAAGRDSHGTYVGMAESLGL